MPRRNHPRHAHACSTNYVTIPAPKQSRMRKTTRGSFRIKASEHDSTKLTQTTDNSWASCPGHSASVGGVLLWLYLLQEPCLVAHHSLMFQHRYLSLSTHPGARSTMNLSPPALLLFLLALPAVIESEGAREQLAAAPAAVDLVGEDGSLNTSALHYGLQWKSWKTSHGRSYLTLVEELERFVIWRANQAFIDYHNSYADKLGFTLRMNKFGDLVRFISLCLSPSLS